MSERSETRPILLGTLLLLAAAIRIAVNNVVTFSRADETVYLLYTKALLAGEGYPKVVRMFLDDPGMWVFPNPLRWSWLGATTIFCSLTGEATHHTLATLSTIAGIVSVALTYQIAQELFGPVVALTATALAATSPLQLALGRRALADEFFCAAVLASLAALLAFLREKEPGPRLAWLAVWIVTTTVAIAAKEQYLFIYPVVLLFWWLRTRAIGWRELAAWSAPPLLFAAVYCLLAREVTSFFRVARIITGAMTAPYAEQFQSGPAHRLILDSLAIAPIATIAALAALVSIALRRGAFPPELRHLAVLAAGMVTIHALLPSLNLRYIVCADPLLRILAAAFVVLELGESRRMVGIVTGALLVNAAIELKLFHAVFMVAQVYDPVTRDLLRALKMIP